MAKKDTNANSDIQIFCYKAMPVRTVDINGETWFVAKDVADILEFEDATHAVRGLDEDEKALRKVETPGGIQDMTIISEAGLYTLLMRSNKEEAKPFRRWVTHDVLPSIRKTGSYSVPNAYEKPEKKKHVSISWVKAVSKIIDMAFSAKTEEDFQKVLALDRLFKQETGYSTLETAGLKLKTKSEDKTSLGIRHGWSGKTLVSRESIHSFEWEHDLPKLPQDRIYSQDAYSDEELIAKGLLRGMRQI